MNIKNIITFLLILALPSVLYADRPPISGLNARVNMLEVEVEKLQSEDLILHEQIDHITAQNLYSIGDTGPGGGIVFYTTHVGLHGLEVAPVDQSNPGAPWGCSTQSIPEAAEIAIGSGRQNTATIMAYCMEPGIAARVADSYRLNGYDDWYLPSKNELDTLYNQQDFVGGPLTIGMSLSYWSSTEDDSHYAYFRSFFNGNQGISLEKHWPFKVRAIRAF